jgi:hypothetical protein
MSDDKAWEDLSDFRMSKDDAWAVIAAAPGCAVTWTRPDGHPLAVWVSHAVLDGEIHLTTTENRPKTRAWQRDARTAAVFAIPGQGAVTAIGRVDLSDDPVRRRRFLQALADKLGIEKPKQASWIGFMDSDGRLTGRLVVDRLISFDERKLAY